MSEQEEDEEFSFTGLFSLDFDIFGYNSSASSKFPSPPPLNRSSSPSTTSSPIESKSSTLQQEETNEPTLSPSIHPMKKKGNLRNDVGTQAHPVDKNILKNRQKRKAELLSDEHVDALRTFIELCNGPEGKGAPISTIRNFLANNFQCHVGVDTIRYTLRNRLGYEWRFVESLNKKSWAPASAPQEWNVFI